MKFNFVLRHTGDKFQEANTEKKNDCGTYIYDKMEVFIMSMHGAGIGESVLL